MLDYNLFEDERLVALSKQGDSAAFSVLCERYFPAAGYHASRFYSTWAEKDDLVQEGMLGLISAVYAYNEKNGAAFSTFANQCIKNRIISFVRTLSSKKHIPAELVVPLDEQANFISGFSTPEESLISQQEAEKIYLLIKNVLTEKERSIFLLFLAGMTYEQIAEKAACTVKSVDSTLQRVRKKLREKLS